MADWYVRPSGGSYGAEDGTSYATAWDGFGDITWGSGGIVAGDTLWVCGAHVSASTHNAVIGTIGASGAAGSPITIRGDYAPDPGSLTGFTSDIVQTTGDWTDQGGNVWRTDLSSFFNTYPRAIYYDGKGGDRDGTPDTLGEWTWGSNNLDVYCTQNPATEWSEILIVHNNKLLVIDGYDYIDVRDLSVRYCNQFVSNADLDDAAIHFTDAENCRAYNITSTDCAKAVLFGTGCTNSRSWNISGGRFQNQDNGGIDRGSAVISNTPVQVHGITVTNTQDLTRGDGLHIGSLIELRMEDAHASLPTGSKVSHCHLAGSGANGIGVSDLKPNKGAITALNIEVSDNHIQTTKVTAESTDADGIGIGGDSGGNYTSSYTTDVVAYRNKILDTYNAGIYWANYSGKNGEAIGNVLARVALDTTVAQGGITTANGCTVCQNTVVGNGNKGQGIEFTDTTIGSPGTNYAYNNIVSGWNVTAALHVSASAGTTNTDYNCLFDNDLDLGGNATNTNGFDADPLFRDAANDDYRLNGGSPCIGAGIEWWTGEPPHGEDGLRFCVPPSMGGYEYYGGGTAAAIPARVVPAGVDMAKAKAA